MRITSLVVAAFVLLVGAPSAFARTKVTVSPRDVHPGDPVMVRVTGAEKAPDGKVGDKALQFFAVRGGHAAVFAVPLDQAAGELRVAVDGAEDVTVDVKAKEFPEASVVVEEEYANPPAAERERIDADNKAIIDAARQAEGDTRFTRTFLRPRGKTTSTFGEWRTFNDGHRSQHLGVDFAESMGTPVKAVNDGTVVLVRECFLAGNVVVVSHGGGIASAYFHLDEASVKEGDKVQRGKTLGKVGATGRTTGPHLHLAVYVPGGFVDPVAFMKLRLQPAPARAAKK